MATSKKVIKDKRIICRMSKAERDTIQKAADYYGLGMSYYIRETLMKESQGFH